MINNINIFIYISICILLILYIYINCNSSYNNDKNITSYNIIIIFLILFLVFFNTKQNVEKKLKKYNEYFTETALTVVPPTTVAPATLVKYGHLKKPISYKDIIYGKPNYYWEGNNTIFDVNPIYSILELKGDCTLNKDNTTIPSTNTRKYMLRFLNTSNTNSLPTNYVLFKLPIDPLTHNTVFVQVRARDKWSNINMCICNNSTKIPVKKIATMCNTINQTDWQCNTSLIGPHNNVALSANGYLEWLSFPISYNDIVKYKDSDNNIFISLNQGLTENFIYTNIEISGIATTSNPYGVYILPISNYQFNNFEILNNSYESLYKNELLKLDSKFNNIINKPVIEKWNNDQQMILYNYNLLIKINIPVIDNNCGIIIGFITHNNIWYDTNPIIYINNNFSKKYILNNLLVGRVGMSIIGRGLRRHPRGIYLSKTFVKNNVIMSNDNINYISLYIDISNDISNLYLRGIYSELVESDTENYIINPAPTKILYDFNKQPISYMENIYDDPIYYWEGFTTIKNNLDITKRFSVINCNMNNTYYLNPWDKRNLFHFNNTSDNNLAPANFILLKVPININTHNTIFLKVRAGDRWTVLNMFLCNKNIEPVNKILSAAASNSGVSSNFGNSSTIGPFNNGSYEGNFEWIGFPIPKIYNTSEFVINNEIYVSINKATNADADIYIAGVAVCANPFAITSLNHINLHWNHNGCFLKNGTAWDVRGIDWGGNYEQESLAQIAPGHIFKIRIPILNDDKGVIIGIITHNSTWYDTNPRIYFEANPDVFYMLSPLVIGKYGLANMNRGISRASRGFFISADDVKKNIKKSFDNTKFMYLEIIIDNSFEIRHLYIRSIYSEAVEPV